VLLFDHQSYQRRGPVHGRPAMQKLTARKFHGDSTPVLFGHYWMPGEPTIACSTAACLDFSVARERCLTAYRWSGENQLSSKHLVCVPAKDPRDDNLNSAMRESRCAPPEARRGSQQEAPRSTRRAPTADGAYCAALSDAYVDVACCCGPISPQISEAPDDRAGQLAGLHKPPQG
jgi:hypothetical protein